MILTSLFFLLSTVTSFDTKCYNGDDLPGGIDVKVEGSTDEEKAQSCKYACLARDDCHIWMLHRSHEPLLPGMCFLKGKNPKTKKISCYSGRVDCHDTNEIVAESMEPAGDAELVGGQEVRISDCIAGGTSITSKMSFSYSQTKTVTWEHSNTVGGSVKLTLQQEFLFWKTGGLEFSADYHYTWSNGGSKSDTIQTTSEISTTFDVRPFERAGVMIGNNNIYKRPVKITYRSCSGDMREMTATVTANIMEASASTQMRYCIKEGKQTDCNSGEGKDAGCTGGGVDSLEYVKCDNDCFFKGQKASCRDRVLWLLQSPSHNVTSAIDQVNQDCQNSCSCNYNSWPPVAASDKIEL